jgi:hypothetical protein
MKFPAIIEQLEKWRELIEKREKVKVEIHIKGDNISVSLQFYDEYNIM